MRLLACEWLLSGSRIASLIVRIWGHDIERAQIYGKPCRSDLGLQRMDQHHQLALWAADCADRVLAVFEAECAGDARPRQAIEAARRWQSGNMPMVTARKMAFAAHAAAREPISKAAVAAARAAGHAAATAHVATHAPHAANYARKARAALGANPDTERKWQIERLPDVLRHLA
ncbi:putative immunity protein [Sphingomonas faeni]|uniref:putative immunity protein n=1 Tax=Sphingomonas faeni TaxID=185950 RepID=UPI00336511D6